jgi:hypothetical protein
LTLRKDSLLIACAIDDDLLIQTNNEGGSTETEVTEDTVMARFFPFAQLDTIQTG